MAISKQKKVAIVKALREQVTKAPAAVFINFHGLNSANTIALRKALRAQAVGLVVAKKTLLRLAFKEATWQGDLPALEGEVAVAFGDDPITPAKSVYRFEQTVKDSVKILGGVYEGKYADAATMLQIAAIPGREELYGKLVNLLSAPIRGLVMVLDQAAKRSIA